MSKSSRLIWLKGIVERHEAVHSIGLVVIGAITASLLFFEVRNIGINSKASLMIAQTQRDQIKISFEKAKQERSKSVIDRMVKSAALLNSFSPAIRLTGIYSFEKLVQDSPDEAVAVARIIATFLIDQQTTKSADEIRRTFLALLRIRQHIDSDYFEGNDTFLDLTGLKLRNMVLKNYSFRGFSLVNTYFDEVRFENVEFTGIDLKGVTFNKCLAEGILNFSDADLSGALFTGNNFSGASFSNAKLTSATIENGIFRNVDFSDADMTMLSYKNVQFHGSINPPTEKYE